jgi:hypothetical protein
VVRSALGQAVTWGWIRRNPADHAEPGEILEDEVEPPADVDVVDVLAEAEEVDLRLALFLQLAIVTGARAVPSVRCAGATSTSGRRRRRPVSPA